MTKIRSLTLLLTITMFGVFNILRANTPESDEALKQHIEQGALLVDVRSPEEFAAGTAPNAINIPLDQIATQIDKLRDQGTIIVFCRSGKRATEAKKILDQAGIKPVINGGTWQRVKTIAQGIKSEHKCCKSTKTQEGNNKGCCLASQKQQ